MNEKTIRPWPVRMEGTSPAAERWLEYSSSRNSILFREQNVFFVVAPKVMLSFIIYIICIACIALCHVYKLHACTSHGVVAPAYPLEHWLKQKGCFEHVLSAGFITEGFLGVNLMQTVPCNLPLIVNWLRHY